MSCCSCISILGYITLGFILYRIYKILHSIVYVHILAKRLGHVINLATYGQWAVITGSSDGIGREYAKELARRGLNVFLISRTQSKLDTVANEIKNASKVEVKTLAFDFSTATTESYDTIRKALNGLEIGILVNNVGMVHSYPEYFLDMPGGGKYYKEMINVNCYGLTELTKLMLPQMIQRHKGVVINVASDSGLIVTPLYCVYSATKCVYPYYVATKAVRMDDSNASFFAPTPEHYATSALNTVGLESQTVGCLSHAIQHAYYQFMPEDWFLAYYKKMCIKDRENYFAEMNKTK